MLEDWNIGILVPELEHSSSLFLPFASLEVWISIFQHSNIPFRPFRPLLMLVLSLFHPKNEGKFFVIIFIALVFACAKIFKTEPTTG
jgi:hypothetical protein